LGISLEMPKNWVEFSLGEIPMNKVNQSKVEVEHEKSPKGSFEIVRRHISVALGGKRDVGVWGGGHPFDVELGVIAKGKKGYAYHAHAA